MAFEPNAYDYEQSIDGRVYRIYPEMDCDGYTAMIDDVEIETFDTAQEAAEAMSKSVPGREAGPEQAALRLRLRNLNWYVRTPRLIGEIE